MGIFQGDTLCAVVIFENYRGIEGTVEIGAAATSPVWLNRSVLHAIADFVFDHLGCQLAVFRTSGNNKRACRFLKKIGCELTVVPRLRGRTEAEHIYTLSDDTRSNNWFGK